MLRKNGQEDTDMICIQQGLVHDAVHPTPYIADVLCSDEGKIVAVGENLDIPAYCTVIDAAGRNVYPGFVEAHCHLGMEEHGIGFEGDDTNECTDILTPHLRAIDAINPMDPTFREAALAGVTSVCTGPGSANVVGGTFAAVKTVGRRIDDMIIRDAAAMKCAFGENPKRVYKEKCNDSRMATAAHLRGLLLRARDYDERLRQAGDDVSKRPAYDMKLEAMLPVLHGEMPLKAHAHRADDLFTAIRIAKEFGVRLTLEHVTEGHLIVEELVKEGLPLAVGPSLTHASKFELKEKTFATPGILARAGCQVSIITDSPVIPQNYLPLCAGLAVRSGMDKFDALRAITLNAAKHIGIQDRVGSIEPGKDADLVVMSGECFEVASTVDAVLVNGQNVPLHV